MIHPPKKAATIVLLREGTPVGFEVYLLKRREKSSFMGGNYVYPGGRIDEEDHHHEICSQCRGRTPVEAHAILGGAFSPEESLAFWIGGIRELFEEAGVLLAHDEKNDLLRFKTPEKIERFAAYRRSINQAEITLCHVAQKEKLLLALDQFHYYAHWITPEARTQRFDTYFFIARHPEGQEAIHDQKETTVGIWITPKAALKENLTGEIVLSPPTLKTLEDLSRFETMEEVFSSLKDREIQPVLPILTELSSEPVIIFPWDREYERFQREDISGLVDHGRPSRPDDNTTRVVLRDGRWLPYCKPLIGTWAPVPMFGE